MEHRDKHILLEASQAKLGKPLAVITKMYYCKVLGQMFAS